MSYNVSCNGRCPAHIEYYLYYYFAILGQHALVKDIYCGIIISVKVGMARRTIPRAVLQRKLIIDCPAAVAGFGRWKPSVNLNDLAAV